MKEILDEIRKAEEEAEVIQLQAIEEAKLMVLNADEESRKIRSGTIIAVKNERIKVIESANKEGQTQASKIISSGKNIALKMIRDTNLSKAINLIKEKVLGKYGNC